MGNVVPSHSRKTVQVHLPDGRIYEADHATPLVEFIQQAETDKPPKSPEETVVAAMIDNRLRELTIPVTRDTDVTPITLRHTDGVRIYRRSLAFLLIAAAEQCFPDTRVFIDHSLPQRAYFCHVEGRPNFTKDDLNIIKKKMHELVEANLSITRTKMSLPDAKQYFAERGDEEKLRLLQFRSRDYLRVYKMGDFSDYFFGYMVPSSGYLQWFDLDTAHDGFFLQYPNEETPTTVEPLVKISKLDEVFRQTGEWLRLLGIRDIGQLNEAIDNGQFKELILIAEALHERRVAEIAQKATERQKHGVRVIMIAGPSSSGKTTFAKRLAVQLMTHGLKPFTLELDNYFVDREQTPLDEHGEYDFESLYAIDLEKLNDHLLHLIAGAEVQIPVFDFRLGRSVAGKQVRLSPEHVIIMEGIHALNPELVPSLSEDDIFGIYVSALTQLNIDRYNRVSTTDVRLLRRIVRDATHRGWTATDTLTRWESVGIGERRNIFPYQERANIMFNSALMYELAVIRPLAEPHLLRVSQEHPKWTEANRLLSFLAWVMPTEDDGVPDNSILREFVGGSNLRDYHPGIQRV